MKTINYIIILFLICSTGCTKDFLDKKPNQKLLVPATLADLRALMDNSDVMNKQPGLMNIGTDDFQISDNGYNALALQKERNAYIWKSEMYGGDKVADWDTMFSQVFYCNVVLDGLQKISRNAANQKEWDELKGTALFLRGLAYYNLAEMFTRPYSTNSNKDAGIPLHLVSDVNIRPGRGTVIETYHQIQDDLLNCIGLLPAHVPVKSRPNTTAAYAVLARMYQTMEDYPKAGEYAEKSLALYDTLIDFNTLDITSAAPVITTLPNGNDELLFFVNSITYQYVSNALTGVNMELYDSYDARDLRKAIYFRDRGNGAFTHKGFSPGPSTAEMYLIRAESYARAGKIDLAMADLNTLLKTRWKGIYSPLVVADADEALAIILKERRKEMVGRRTRWTDLRRLNKDPRFAVILKRVVKGETYILNPNDNRYTFAIPDSEIKQNSIEQNIR